MTWTRISFSCLVVASLMLGGCTKEEQRYLSRYCPVLKTYSKKSDAELAAEIRKHASEIPQSILRIKDYGQLRKGIRASCPK